MWCRVWGARNGPTFSLVGCYFDRPQRKLYNIDFVGCGMGQPFLPVDVGPYFKRPQWKLYSIDFVGYGIHVIGQPCSSCGLLL